uniref:ORF103 n=1 Tax=Paenarthrobacter nicotinovorans TaxID=29320 RepID=Q93NH0_PAENI|nr:ORF103 [Paenarthrobacter nicotinovorans]CAD47947.1 hypothetical protein [Paenarthrobacter nicotinovorans]
MLELTYPRRVASVGRHRGRNRQRRRRDRPKLSVNKARNISAVACRHYGWRSKTVERSCEACGLPCRRYSCVPEGGSGGADPAPRGRGMSPMGKPVPVDLVPAA